MSADKISNFHRLTVVCKLTMALTLSLFATAILISYPYAEYFSMPVQIAAHILTIVFAGIVKLACVLLMVGIKEREQLQPLEQRQPVSDLSL